MGNALENDMCKLRIENLLKRENVQIVTEKVDWSQALCKAILPLVCQGYVTQDYLEEIRTATAEQGAYYVITPDIALAHARPDQGVRKNQISVALFRKPVFFQGKVHPISLVIALAAENSDDHLEVLSLISKIFRDVEREERILCATTEDKLFNEFLER